MGIEVSLDHRGIDHVFGNSEIIVGSKGDIDVEIGQTAFDGPLGFEGRRVDTRTNQHLKLLDRNITVLHFFFKLKHHAPFESFRCFEPSFEVFLGCGRIGDELREACDVGLATLHQVFLGGGLLLDGVEPVLGFLNHTGTDNFEIVLEFGLEFGDRGCQSGLFNLFVQNNLADERAENIIAELCILLVFKALVLELILLNHLETRIKFRVRDLAVVHDTDRIALRTLRNTVHCQQAHDNTCRENNNNPLGLFIYPR